MQSQYISSTQSSTIFANFTFRSLLKVYVHVTEYPREYRLSLMLQCPPMHSLDQKASVLQPLCLCDRNLQSYTESTCTGSWILTLCIVWLLRDLENGSKSKAFVTTVYWYMTDFCVGLNGKKINEYLCVIVIRFDSTHIHLQTKHDKNLLLIDWQRKRSCLTIKVGDTKKTLAHKG